MNIIGDVRSELLEIRSALKSLAFAPPEMITLHHQRIHAACCKAFDDLHAYEKLFLDVPPDKLWVNGTFLSPIPPDEDEDAATVYVPEGHFVELLLAAQEVSERVRVMEHLPPSRLTMAVENFDAIVRLREALTALSATLDHNHVDDEDEDVEQAPPEDEEDTIP